MLRKILILLPCFIYLCNSQAIIWETEYKLDFKPSSTNLVLVDSYGNIINIIDGGLNIIDGKAFSYFLKFNNNGEFLTQKELFSSSLVNKKGICVPISICQTGTEYQILGGISSSSFFLGDKVLPMITNTNQDGDTTITHNPYDINIASNYTSYGINKSSHNVAADKKFFNGYDKKWVEINEFESVSNSHIIIGCYDTLGQMLWRKGYDSLGIGGESYSLYDIKATQFKTIILLCHQYGTDDSDTRLKLIEIDYDGNVVNRFIITLNDAKFTPMEVIRFDDGNYCFLNFYLDSTPNYLNFIWITDSQGNIIKEVEIPHKGLRTNLNKLKLSNDGGLICLGSILINRNKLEDLFDDIGNLYIIKMNKELEIKWEYESSTDSLLDIGLQDLINLKDNEFIVTGYKNRNNFYLAKFKDLDSTSNYIENELNNQNIIISPNPVNDILSINSSIELSKIEIFSALGLKVLETEWKEKIDVSGLASGVYFLRAGYKIVKFIKI
ncbi:MAG TPA: T9SS type A sorting domain-containing protein [Candidatus Kapabacteria bacterium]|nr:T9SS type A sorting domain-containing protein [Candidatus Kapabacteria bacterium]